MMRSLHRRLDRLTEQIAVGRMIVLSIAVENVEDRALIDGTLASAAIEREEQDLVVLIKRYGTIGTEPPCSLSSVSPLPRAVRKVLP